MFTFAREMVSELSILIPTYNTCCVELVNELRHQASTMVGLRWEIVVADDGSGDSDCVRGNGRISTFPNCRYIVRSKNVGRAAIRNFLADSARYEWLLFIDDDMRVSHSTYLSNYCSSGGEIIYGGYGVSQGDDSLSHNLRYLYECATLPAQSAEKRAKTPHQHFHTCNFLIRRDLMQKYPFDERFRQYGYEDVFFGKTLAANNQAITHIDNPLLFTGIEPNHVFLRKTEEGLRTLDRFSAELKDYSRLLQLSEKISDMHIKWAFTAWHQLFGAAERRLLSGRHPSLWLFKLYKLGYFMSIRTTHSA